jgi:hypothetical protein
MFTAWARESSGDDCNADPRQDATFVVPLLLAPGPTLVITHDAMQPQAHGDDGSRNPVLVLSSDPLAAALLGAAIDLAGLAPRFPKLGEAPRGALLRVRPRLVVIDCDHEDGCSEAFVGPALMTGSQVVLFRSRRTQRDVSEMASRLGLRTVEMPQEHHELTALLRELVRQ